MIKKVRARALDFILNHLAYIGLFLMVIAALLILKENF